MACGRKERHIVAHLLEIRAPVPGTELIIYHSHTAVGQPHYPVRATQRLRSGERALRHHPPEPLEPRAHTPVGQNLTEHRAAIGLLSR